MTVDEFHEFSTYREQADGTIIYQGRLVGRGGLRQEAGRYEFTRLNGSVAIVGPRIVAPWASADAEPGTAAAQEPDEIEAEPDHSMSAFAASYWRGREAEARAGEQRGDAVTAAAPKLDEREAEEDGPLEDPFADVEAVCRRWNDPTALAAGAQK